MEVINRNAVAAFVGPDGATIRELAASRNSSAQKQSLAEAIIPADGTVTLHYHKVTEELYYILSGTGLMTIEDEVKEVGPGDTIVIVPGQRHKIANKGKVPLVLLACCSPQWSADDNILVE